MIMCVLLCYPVSIRIYYQQGGRFLVFKSNIYDLLEKNSIINISEKKILISWKKFSRTIISGKINETS